MTENQEKSSGKHRGWVYAEDGDYHRNLDPNWCYTPTYLRKMSLVENWLDQQPKESRILDAGCGEGVTVEKYAARGYQMQGVDLNYESEYVTQGDLLDLPFEDDSFDATLCLDVFEHVSFADQPRLLGELRRVTKPGGAAILTIPNLAHFNSRWMMFWRGRLDRTDDELNHIGERPVEENARILKDCGYKIEEIKGITLTVPWVYRNLICGNPAKYRGLHDWLEQFARPSLAMLTFFRCVVPA
jgi:SAM-dependent methyltransferase